MQKKLARTLDKPKQISKYSQIKISYLNPNFRSFWTCSIPIQLSSCFRWREFQAGLLYMLRDDIFARKITVLKKGNCRFLTLSNPVSICKVSPLEPFFGSLINSGLPIFLARTTPLGKRYLRIRRFFQESIEKREEFFSKMNERILRLAFQMKFKLLQNPFCPDSNLHGWLI